jgi:alcohol dehydrogenase YqhD (iron-dependent ADH family)
MHNFEWNLPTNIVYGPGELARLGKISNEFGRKAFLATYRPNEKRAWILEKAVSSLEEAGIEVTIFDRIEPNPRAETVDRGVELFLQSGSDFVVALGGGSVIDAAKYISATAYSGGLAWDYVILAERPAKEYTGAHPIVAVPTVSAAGSEANAGGVITNWETKEKSFSRSPYRIPKVAIVDPEVFVTVPKEITADGGVDIFSHLIEHYLTSSVDSEIADRITEGLILTTMEYLDRALQDGGDLEARGQLALCALLGWSGIQALGRTGSIPIHFIEHQVSGHYDISHGRGMALLIPAYLEHFADARPERWAKLARRIFHVNEDNDLDAARALGPAVAKWLERIDMHLTFSDLKIGSEKFDQMTDDIVRMYGTLEGNEVPGPRPMNRDDILAIFNASL